MRGKVVGIPKEYSLPGIPEEINVIWEKAAQLYEKGGAKIK